MWELRLLTNRWAFTVCYRDSFDFFLQHSCTDGDSHIYCSRKHNISLKYFKERELTLNIASFAAATKDGTIGAEDGRELPSRRI
jgi:hypothetical protein